MPAKPLSPDEKVDLTNCDREPIQFLGHVQSFGCLVSVTADWMINHVSRNVSDHLGLDPEEMIGQPALDVFSEEAVHEIRTRVQLLTHDDAVERIFALRALKQDERHFHVGIHISGGSILLEFEPFEDARRNDYMSYVRPMLERVQTAKSVEELCEIGARQVRGLTGFDRVMVYRFAPDQTGEVIAEARKRSLEPFLGLRYPASDIPSQARELYRRNLLRIISNVNDKVSPIIPERGPDGGALDLSMSGLRAVSPIHIEYLKNMGVEASLSISILKDGKLWGLFACHHYSPRVLPYDVRTAAELFAQMFSMLLRQVETDAAREQARQAQSLHDRIMAQLAEGSAITDNFEMIADAMSSVIPCDGVAGWIDKSFRQIGKTPNEEEFKRLTRFLNTAAPSRVYSTDALSEVYPAAENFQDRAAGLLSLPVSRTPRDYIILFREPITKHVNWAGNPEKPAEVGPNGIRLTPRKSFEAWQETVEGQSAPWTEGETQAAEALRITLLEVVLRMTEAASEDRARARERQDLLIAELNHRVRNILNLIRGLVSQSQGEARTVAEFTNVVGGRIQALARAHDQITQENWAPASLRELITTELEAYFGAKSARVDMAGPDAYLTPSAFSTLSLVIHELATNSAKYGALSDSTGRIAISVAEGSAGELELGWRESGGPAVQAPKRRGFGSTIIERSVPYELNGTANIRFELTGLEADFTVPSSYVHEFRAHQDTIAQKAPRAEPASDASDVAGRNVLIVEDNMIIALDAEEIIGELGAASVHISASVNEALGVMDRIDVNLAVLDVNLGSETSEAVAHKLSEAGVPFVFATGYGDATSLTRKFPSVPILKKPYREDTLAEAVHEAIAETRSEDA